MHGNLPALEAVLAEVATLDVDGSSSAATSSPGRSRASARRLLALGAVFVRGNGDRRASGRLWAWVASASIRSRSSSCASVRSLSLGGVLYCHGSPRNDEEILTRVSPDERFRVALAGVEERLVVGGHTHVQFDREIDGIRFVNAGSVGMPYEGRPGAFWAVVDGDGSSTGTRRTRSTRR